MEVFEKEVANTNKFQKNVEKTEEDLRIVEQELELTIQEIEDIMDCTDLGKHILKSIEKDEEELEKMWKKYQETTEIRERLEQHFRKALAFEERIREESAVLLFWMKRYEIFLEKGNTTKSDKDVTENVSRQKEEEALRKEVEEAVMETVARQVEEDEKDKKVREIVQRLDENKVKIREQAEKELDTKIKEN